MTAILGTIAVLLMLASLPVSIGVMHLIDNHGRAAGVGFGGFLLASAAGLATMLAGFWIAQVTP